MDENISHTDLDLLPIFHDSTDTVIPFKITKMEPDHIVIAIVINKCLSMKLAAGISRIQWLLSSSMTLRGHSAKATDLICFCEEKDTAQYLILSDTKTNSREKYKETLCRS